MKILCTADLHLGKTIALPNDSSIDETKYSADKTWYNIVDKLIEDEYDLLLVAGDILDKSNSPFKSRELLFKGLDKIKKYNVSDKKIEVVFIAGNHDGDRLGKIMSQTEYDFVHLIGLENKWERCEIKGLPIWGWSFDCDEYKKDPFAHKSVKQINDDKYILMVHGDYSAYDGIYAPMANSISSDIVKNSIITLAGHIHKKDIKGNLYNLGSPQAFDFGEKGEHGVWTVELDDKYNLLGEPIFEPMSSVYYDECKIDVFDYETGELLTNIISNQLLSKKGSGEISYFRLIFSGRLSKDKYRAFCEEIQSEDFQETSFIRDDIYIEPQKCINNTLADYDLEEMSKQDNSVGIVAKMILAIDKGEFQKDYSDFYEKIKTESEDFVSDIVNCIGFESDDDLLYRIKNNLIKILDGRSKK